MSNHAAGKEFAADQVGPVSARERIELLDVLRGLAVGGILIGNMQWFSGYGMMPPALAAQTPIADQVTHFLVHFFVEGKFYSIFSFLFGVGFAVQIAGAEERGDANATLFKRRLFWLLVIGLLHGLLLWAGDILSVYAFMGFVLLLFRKKSDEQLLKWAFWLMIVPVVTYILLLAAFLAFAPPDTAAAIDTAMAEQWTTNIQTVGQGSYWQITTEYNLLYIVGRYVGLVMQMRLPKILAMFLLGLYAYRRGVFHDPSGHASVIRKVLIYGILLGLVGNVIMAASSGNEAAFPPSVEGLIGVFGYSFGVPALALGIIAAVTTLWQKPAWRRLLAVLAPVGRMALTNYLMQTVICITIFYGYGFGQFGKYGAARATLIALTVFVVQIVLSAVWLKFFAYGPMEWIWRQLTYRKWLSLRRAA
jgi:uncharacterized protein